MVTKTIAVDKIHYYQKIQKKVLLFYGKKIICIFQKIKQKKYKIVKWTFWKTRRR